MIIAAIAIKMNQLPNAFNYRIIHVHIYELWGTVTVFIFFLFVQVK